MFFCLLKSQGNYTVAKMNLQTVIVKSVVKMFVTILIAWLFHCKSILFLFFTFNEFSLCRFFGFVYKSIYFDVLVTCIKCK